jgi:diguanylate cyclase (GGDEF)-like protein/putative nucleotidyltransferase with HDIG domain
MGRYTPAARIWVIAIVLTGLAISIVGLDGAATAESVWPALVVFALCAAIAHAYPIKSAFDGATYQLTNAFLVAGAMILPAGLLLLLPLAAITPSAWRQRQRPGAIVRWAFNVSQTALAMQAAHLGAEALRVAPLPHTELLSLLGAAIIFTLTQALIVGMAIACQSRVPLARADTLAGSALLSDGLVNILGALVAALWLQEPTLLILFAPAFLIAHRLTRGAQLAQLAQLDSKTGLHNVRFFEQALEEEVSRSARLRQPFAVIFADLDHFKRINDTHGHAAGDRVLQDVGQLLRDWSRTGDLVARFGGEEFVAILRGIDAHEAAYLGEELRRAIEQHAFTLPGGTTLHCTVSIGLACCPEDATTVATLMERADAAMYRAKQARNTVARAGALPAVPRLPITPPSAAGNEGARKPPGHSPLADVALWGCIAAGMVAAAGSIVAVARDGEWLALLPFVVLAAIAESAQVQIHEANKQRFSFTFTIAATMAAVALVPQGAPLISLAAGVIHSARTFKPRQWGKELLKPANPALSAAVASLLYVPLSLAMVFPGGRLLAGLLAVLGFYVTNVGIVALMIKLHAGRPLWMVLRDSLWSAPIAILLGLTGVFLGAEYRYLGVIGTAMFFVPLLIMRFTLAFSARKSQQAIQTLQSANQEVEQAHQEKEQTLRQLIETVAAIIDARDNAIAGHSERVARYAVALGEELGLNPTELAYLHTAGLLHDLGKIAVPEAILHKPSKLTDAEYAVVKQHAATGERLLSAVAALPEVARMVGDHHERFDGTGYPTGQRGTEISRGGRIIAVADTLDSILSDRPYSQGKSLSWALDELDRCAGSHFDPEIVTALHTIVASRGLEFFADKPAGGMGFVTNSVLPPRETDIAALARVGVA